MDGLISLLLFAVFFFVMMRFGCGAHMVHGGHGKRGHKSGSDVKHIDPVCGMQISPEEGYGKMYDGQLFRFCSRTCLDKFEVKPETFRGREKEVAP
jgi:YHS domain-containing protein